MKLIFGLRGLEVSSHCLFVDDAMVFYKGDRGTIASLINLFSIYVISSDQIVNPQKSHILSSSVTEFML